MPKGCEYGFELESLLWDHFLDALNLVSDNGHSPQSRYLFGPAPRVYAGAFDKSDVFLIEAGFLDSVLEESQKRLRVDTKSSSTFDEFFS